MGYLTSTQGLIRIALIVFFFTNNTIIELFFINYFFKKKGIPNWWMGNFNFIYTDMLNL